MTKSIKSSVDGMNDVHAVLASAGIPAMLSGEIRLFQRKLGSTREDCVINTLIWDADQIQGGILNVNFHVPNLPSQTGENPTVKDNTQPDIARMKELGDVASASMDMYEGYDFSLRLRDPGQIENFGTQWMYNIQVEYKFLRIDTKLTEY